MAEDFERDERRKFGENGFEGYVARVVQLEKEMGVNNLSQFTPT